MSSIKKHLSIALLGDTLEVEKAIDAQTSTDTLEIVKNKVDEQDQQTQENQDPSVNGANGANGDVQTEEDDQEPQLEKDNGSSNVSQTSEEINDLNKSVGALEALVDILESSQDFGGIDQNEASMLDTVCSAIVAGHGIKANEKLSLENFNSFSKRMNLSMEAKDTIKEYIVKIWEMIISAYQKMSKFIKTMIHFYKSDMFAQQAILQKNEQALKLIKTLDTDSNKTFKGVIPQVLLMEKGQNSSDVVSAAETTESFLTDIHVVLKKDFSTASEKLDDYTDKVLNISLEENEELKNFTREDLVQFGQILGVHLQSKLSLVSSVKEFVRPSSTAQAYQSPGLAGNFKFTMFIADKQNLNSEDIIKSRLYFQPEERENEDLELPVAEVSDINKLIAVQKKLFTAAKRTYELFISVDNNISKIIKTAESSKTKVVKLLYKNLDGAGIETNQRSGVKVYSELTTTIKIFYVDSINNLLRYINKYIKAINFYIGQSIREYA